MLLTLPLTFDQSEARNLNDIFFLLILLIMTYDMSYHSGKSHIYVVYLNLMTIRHKLGSN